MQFEGFFGNEELKSRLSRVFDGGRAPHAILLEGPAGCGKKTLARLLAAAFLCVSEGEKPCGVCVSCVKAFSGNHPDIRLVSGGAGPRSFSVESVRTVRGDAFIAPNEGVCKVYILADIQTMSDAAQNALLKILEEPPAFVRFILTCVSRELVLETVRSRCAVFSLGPVSEGDAAQAIEKLRDVPTEEARRAAALAEGNIGRALAALEDGGLGKAATLAEEFADALARRRDYTLLALTGRLEQEKELYAAFLLLLPLLFRDAVALRTGQQTLLSGCRGAAQTLSRSLPLSALTRMQQKAARALEAVDKYANHTLLLTWLFAGLMSARSG